MVDYNIEIEKWNVRKIMVQTIGGGVLFLALLYVVIAQGAKIDMDTLGLIALALIQLMSGGANAGKVAARTNGG